jgi:hypothetical protein
MAQIQSPETYADGQQVTASRLNNQTNGAVLLPGAVTDQTPISGGVASGDGLIVHDDSVSALRKATVGEVLGGGVPVVASSVTGVAGSDLTITPTSGQKVDVIGQLQAQTIASTGNALIQGEAQCAALSVGGEAYFNTNTAIKIPVGITGDRPPVPVAGHLRYNSTLDQAEIYSGTEWKAVGGSPFDASGGVITTIDGYKIHTYTVSGTFTPSLTAEGKVEVLVVGGGGGGSYAYAGAGGGGGAVVYGVLNIAKNTTPISVVVGNGGAVGSAGGTSYFSSLTANGGNPGSGGSGGASGSGNAGTTGSSKSGGGGGGAGSPSLHMWTGGGVGGEGFGSSISGTLVNYGGGGGGCGNSSETGSGSGNYGAWGPAGGGRGANSTRNASVARLSSGGGGGGGTSYNDRNASAGADGVVIIRYRVS